MLNFSCKKEYEVVLFRECCGTVSTTLSVEDSQSPELKPFYYSPVMPLVQST